MRKFIVDRTEIKEAENGMKYIDIFDSEDNNWYEEQKNFQESTLKVMYNKNTLQVSSTSRDVTIIAPTMAGDVVEEIEHEDIEVTPTLHFVKGKLVELKECETIKNGEIVFDRESKIEQVKRELKELKETRIMLGVKIKEGIYHPLRDTDKVNISLEEKTWTGNRRWKFYDENGNGVIDDLTLEIIDKMLKDGKKILDGVILGGLEAENALNDLTDEELQNLDVKAYFEKYYTLAGGI